MDRQLVAAVDLGGTKVLAGLVDRSGAILRREERPTTVTDETALLRELEEIIRGLLSDEPAAVGMGLPSMIDQPRGRAVSSVNIPLAGVELRAFLAERLDLPVAIENDGNAAALAEFTFGAGRGARHLIMLTLGTGVGGGLILDGRLYRGAVGAAGELGHVTLDLDGPPCQGSCPGVGHLEALASGSAADRLAERVARERPDGDLGRARAEGQRIDARVAVELAARGVGDAREVVETIGWRLGVALADLTNVFNPEVVVIGGGFSRAGDLLLEPARRVIRERALAPARDLVRVVPAALGVEAGLIGAGLVGFEALGALPAP